MLVPPIPCGNGGWLVLITNVVLIFGPMQVLWKYSSRFKLLRQITTYFSPDDGNAANIRFYILRVFKGLKYKLTRPGRKSRVGTIFYIGALSSER